MSKELEALNRLGKDNGYDYTIEDFARDYKLVEDGLKRLEKYENQKPKKRYSVSYSYFIIYKYSGTKHTFNKSTAIESFKSERLKDYFKNWNDNNYYRECLSVIVRDRWNNHKLIYKGNNYNEFRKAAEKYERR